MNSSSLFFCIPKIIVQVKSVVQSVQEKKVEIPDGPNIVLVCQNIDQMILINEKILRGREVTKFVNIDTTSKPASFGIFFDIKDVRGINLSVKEVELLCSMTITDYHAATFSGIESTNRVMFGNGVDIQDTELNILIEGKMKFGKFNFMVGYDIGDNLAMFCTLKGGQPLIIESSEEYTTEVYEKYLENCLNQFRGN